MALSIVYVSLKGRDEKHIVPNIYPSHFSSE